MHELTDIEKAVLIALAHACNFSLSAHPPIEAVTRSFSRHLRGDAKKTLKKLGRKGYCNRHPAHAQTWQLSRHGLQKVLDLVK